MALNRPTKAALAQGEKIFDRALCVVGAVLFSQAPEFMQQYLQTIGGALLEAERNLAQYHDIAKETGQTFEQFVSTTKAIAADGVAKLGDVMEASSSRVAELTAAETALRDATPLTRPFAFISHLDGAILNKTWSLYKPAVPTTLEGALYAAFGMVVLLVLYHGLVRQPCVHAYERRIARKSARDAAMAATAPKPAGPSDREPTSVA